MIGLRSILSSDLLGVLWVFCFGGVLGLLGFFCFFLGGDFLILLYFYGITFMHANQHGATCSSVVRAFAHGAMGCRIDPSWGGPIELFLVPASAPRLV